MNNKALTLSLVMAVMAVFFVQSYVSSIEDEARRRFGEPVTVVVAKKNIKEQDTVDESMITFKLVPGEFKQPGSINFPKELLEDEKEQKKKMKALIGTIAIVPIREGEQITYNKITEPNVRTGLSPQVTPGKRAFAVPINETSGVAKLVKPGDRVDVVAVIQTGTGKESKVARTVFQDVVVLATGRNVTNNVARLVEMDPFTGKEKIKSLSEDTSFSSVTLELEPQQAQSLALILGDTQNSVALTLRNNDDTERVNVEAVTYDEVAGPEGRALRAPAQQRR